MPLRSHGSLSMNRALMAAGLVDRVQVTIFPVLTGRTGIDPIFKGAADFDLRASRATGTLDGHTQELQCYRPALPFDVRPAAFVFFDLQPSSTCTSSGAR